MSFTRCLVLVGWIAFLTGGTFSFTAPFLADEFINREIEEKYVGIVFSMHSVGRMIATLFSIYLINKLGRKLITKIGCFALFIVFLGTSLSTLIEHKAAFGILLLVLRLLNGAGSGIIMLSSL